MASVSGSQTATDPLGVVTFLRVQLTLLVLKLSTRLQRKEIVVEELK